MNNIDCMDITKWAQGVINNFYHVLLTKVDFMLQQLVQICIYKLYHKTDLGKIHIWKFWGDREWGADYIDERRHERVLVEAVWEDIVDPSHYFDLS